MSTEPQLPKDPLAAAELLATLEEKDKEETRCSYPTCYELRQVAAGTGRPSAYCQNPKHTAVTNHRARLQLQKLVSGIPEAPSKRENPFPAGVVNVESLRGSVVNEMRQLQGNLERYVATLAEIADPDISVAQLQATQDRAEARIAEAQQSVSAERSLRLAAEAASVAARKDAQAEREAAELAISAMEETEARIQRLSEATEQQITEIQAERDTTIEHVRTEAQLQREESEKQAREAIAAAQSALATAEVQARQADIRAHDAQVDASAQVATAEQLVSEARATLERERAEVDRLRAELATVRSQTEADRNETRATLERERAEVDRLRAELATAHLHTENVTKRADQLTIVTDELRTQLVQAQAQITEREKTHQE